MAVLPTPGSPISTGLFLVRRARIWMTRWISFSRPMTGSSLPSRASAVRSRPNSSSVGVGFAPRAAGFFFVAGLGLPLAGVAPAADLQDRPRAARRRHGVACEVARDHDAPFFLRRRPAAGARCRCTRGPCPRASSAESSRIFLPRLDGGTSPEDEPALALGQALLDLGLHLPEVHLRPLQGLHGHPFPVLAAGRG